MLYKFQRYNKLVRIVLRLCYPFALIFYPKLFIHFHILSFFIVIFFLWVLTRHLRTWSV